MLYNELKLKNSYEAKPDLIANSPLIYFKLLTNYQINKSKYIQIIDQKTNQDIFNCVIYYIGNKFNKTYMKLPYKIKYELADIIISEQFRGLGYGTIILNTILNKFKEKFKGSIFLWTLSDNNIAIQLYNKLGFKQITISKKLDKFYRHHNKWINSNSLIIGFIFDLA